MRHSVDAGVVVLVCGSEGQTVLQHDPVRVEVDNGAPVEHQSHRWYHGVAVVGGVEEQVSMWLLGSAGRYCIMFTLNAAESAEYTVGGSHVTTVQNP